MPESKIFKQFISKVEVDDDERTVTAVITTTAVDRDKEVLRSSGADFEQYLKNPVVLWAHSYSEPPIARSQWIKKGTKKITAKIEFAETEKAEEIYQLYKGGFLKAFSVGFIPSKSHTPTPDEIKKKPELAEVYRIYDEWELLEFSAVPVPSNPEALATAVKSKQIELTKDLADELGIDDEEVFVLDIDTARTTAVVTNFAKRVDDEIMNLDVELETDPINTSAMIKSSLYVRTEKQEPKEVDIKSETKKIINRLKGKVC